MNFNYVFTGLVLGYFVGTSEGVRMTLTPSSVVVGGGSADPTAVPTVSTQYLTMECIPEATGSIQTIYSLYIKRKRPTDNDYITFALIDAGVNQATLRDNAPQDIRNKNPLLDGQINNNNDVYSSVLRVRFLMSTLDCEDEASYQCEMNYLPINQDSTKVSNNQNLVVTVYPGNLQIQGSIFDGFFMNPIQNMSIIQVSTQYEFSCTGDIGTSQSTTIQWYRKMPPYELGIFQPVALTNPADTIDNGSPIKTVCHYRTTSKLRYTPSSRSTPLIMRCQVQTQTNNGQPFTAMSQEFHLASVITSGSGSSVSRIRTSVLMLTIGIILTILT